MDRYEARKAMVADLEAQGLLVKVEEHVHNVGTHDRCEYNGRADDQAAVVRKDGRDGKTGHRSDQERRPELRSGAF